MNYWLLIFIFLVLVAIVIGYKFAGRRDALQNMMDEYLELLARNKFTEADEIEEQLLRRIEDEQRVPDINNDKVRNISMAQRDRLKKFYKLGNDYLARDLLISGAFSGGYDWSDRTGGVIPAPPPPPGPPGPPPPPGPAPPAVATPPASPAGTHHGDLFAAIMRGAVLKPASARTTGAPATSASSASTSAAPAIAPLPTTPRIESEVNAKRRILGPDVAGNLAEIGPIYDIVYNAINVILNYNNEMVYYIDYDAMLAVDIDGISRYAAPIRALYTANKYDRYLPYFYIDALYRKYAFGADGTPKNNPFTKELIIQQALYNLIKYSTYDLASRNQLVNRIKETLISEVMETGASAIPDFQYAIPAGNAGEANEWNYLRKIASVRAGEFKKPTGVIDRDTELISATKKRRIDSIQALVKAKEDELTARTLIIDEKIALPQIEKTKYLNSIDAINAIPSRLSDIKSDFAEQLKAAFPTIRTEADDIITDIKRKAIPFATYAYKTGESLALLSKRASLYFVYDDASASLTGILLAKITAMNRDDKIAAIIAHIAKTVPSSDFIHQLKRKVTTIESSGTTYPEKLDILSETITAVDEIYNTFVPGQEIFYKITIAADEEDLIKVAIKAMLKKTINVKYIDSSSRSYVDFYNELVYGDYKSRYDPCVIMREFATNAKANPTGPYASAFMDAMQILKK